jgi:hypothetical protein
MVLRRSTIGSVLGFAGIVEKRAIEAMAAIAKVKIQRLRSAPFVLCGDTSVIAAAIAIVMPTRFDQL